MLATVIRRYWHALCRDVMALGYRVSDMFTALSWSEMVSIVVGAPPTSSVRFFLDQGWTRESHVLANMAEQQAGIARLQQPYPRPGVEYRPAASAGEGKAFQADAYTWNEYDELERKRYERAQKAPPGTTRVRVM
jgi:hypothetical protein